MYELYDRSQFFVSSHFSSGVKFAIFIQVLGEMDGDVDAAIEYMIAERVAVSTDDADGDPYMDHPCNGKYAKLS